MVTKHNRLAHNMRTCLITAWWYSNKTTGTKRIDDLYLVIALNMADTSKERVGIYLRYFWYRAVDTLSEYAKAWLHG